MEKELLIQAIENNDLIAFLEGKGIYSKSLNYWVPVEVPTDWTKIIPKGIYALYKEKPELELDLLLEDALIKMMDGEVFDLYVALSVIHFQLIREDRNDSPFRINREKLFKKLKIKLLENEVEFRRYFEWSGKGKPEGLWSEVKRICNIIKRKWNISLLDS